MNPHTRHTASPKPGEVCLLSTSTQRYFRNPLEIYSTSNIGEVSNLLNTIDARVRGEDLYTAGYIAYEAAAAFDEALVTHTDTPSPLIWFGLYDAYEDSIPESSNDEMTSLKWKPGIEKSTFETAIATIHEHIAAGDTYQVNYTFPLHTHFSGDAYAWFRRICAAQRADYCAYINTAEHVIMSISPELFFTLDGNQLRTQPMKGTIARGLTSKADEAQRLLLQESVKDRAENLMIVDLLRNDMGRIAQTGSVQVETLFDLTPFDRLWQMTSTIKAHTQAEVPELFRSLFPCGSVTGAPKIMTSRIIRDLEPTPRGAYCGAIGYWGPNRQAEFNVAIRTATLDSNSGHMTYPVGAGITWDSSSEAEYKECLLKAAVVKNPKPFFDIIESMLWDGEYFLLDRHLERLAQSAAYFGYSLDEEDLHKALTKAQPSDKIPHKVRVLLARNGFTKIEVSLAETLPRQRLSLAHHPVQSTNVFLYHKTTHRQVYNEALAHVDGDDVLLWNERDEITESSSANVVVKIDGQLFTPPIDSGLLAGTYRAELLAQGKIQERTISKSDLKQAQSIKLINSVRKWIDIELVSP